MAAAQGRRNDDELLGSAGDLHGAVRVSSLLWCSIRCRCSVPSLCRRGGARRGATRVRSVHLLWWPWCSAPWPLTVLLHGGGSGAGRARSWPVRRIGPARWRAPRAVARGGGRVVLAAPFLPIFNTIVPIAAGSLRMPYRRFLAYAAVGSALWGAGYVTLGLVAQSLGSALFGESSVLTTLLFGIPGLAIGWVTLAQVRRRMAVADPVQPERRAAARRRQRPATRDQTPRKAARPVPARPEEPPPRLAAPGRRRRAGTTGRRRPLATARLPASARNGDISIATAGGPRPPMRQVCTMACLGSRTAALASGVHATRPSRGERAAAASASTRQRWAAGATILTSGRHARRSSRAPPQRRRSYRYTPAARTVRAASLTYRSPSLSRTRNTDPTVRRRHGGCPDRQRGPHPPATVARVRSDPESHCRMAVAPRSLTFSATVATVPPPSRLLSSPVAPSTARPRRREPARCWRAAGRKPSRRPSRKDRSPHPPHRTALRRAGALVRVHSCATITRSGPCSERPRALPCAATAERNDTSLVVEPLLHPLDDCSATASITPLTTADITIHRAVN